MAVPITVFRSNPQFLCKLSGLQYRENSTPRSTAYRPPRFDLEPPAQNRRPLAHTGQTARLPECQLDLGVETLSRCPLSRGSGCFALTRSARSLLRRAEWRAILVSAFLHDPEGGRFDLRRKAFSFEAVMLKIDPDTGLRSVMPEVPQQGRKQSQVVESCRAQVKR